jgi:hypothetical protein
MSRLGSNYGAYARVPICRACGNPFVPPGFDGCCSVRCTEYLAIAGQPVLGEPIFCQRDEPIRCWGCEVSFMSRGLRVCPECYYFRARPTPDFEPARNSTGQVRERNFAPTSEPIIDRDPRSRCHW